MKTLHLRALRAAALLAILPAAPAIADHGSSGSGPATSGLLVGASATTLEQGGLVLALDASLAEPANRSDATLAQLAGQHIHAHDQDSGQVYAIGLAYGVSSNLTMAVTLPYSRRVSIREGEHSHSGSMVTNEVVARGSSSGLGDATIETKWRFTGENHHGWEAALIAGIKVPTGATDRIDREGERFETEHQPGTGSWDPVFGLALTRPLKHGGLHASASYQIATTGSQDTRLGDRAQAAIGLTWRAAGEAVDYHAAKQTARASQPALDLILELNAEWEGRLHEAGELDRNSGGKALLVSPGLRFGTGRWAFYLGASVPLSQDIRPSHSPASHRLRLGIARSF